MNQDILPHHGSLARAPVNLDGQVNNFPQQQLGAFQPVSMVVKRIKVLSLNEVHLALFVHTSVVKGTVFLKNQNQILMAVLL